LRSGAYCVPARPIDFHCHGVGSFDFSDINGLDLATIDGLVCTEGVDVVMTLYLKHDDIEAFLNLCRELGAAKRDGLCPHIVGIALEGPMLVSPGGTPLDTIWAPTQAEWRALASCGQYGLKYVVLSPDIEDGSGEFIGTGDLPPTVSWIAETLLDSGVLPALGHFRKESPRRSAAAVQQLLDTARRRGEKLVSDHLFNDMPRLFKHSWRTREERLNRDAELKEIAPWNWSFADLENVVGPVPASLLAGAREGDMTLCLNFDGDHVDLDISTRVIDLLGSDRLIGMTDRIDGRKLGGRSLSQGQSNTLLYQHEGIVAAGTQHIDQQMVNLRRHGVSDQDIWRMFAFNPAQVLKLMAASAVVDRPAGGSFIDAEGLRYGFIQREPTHASSPAVTG